MKKTVIFDFDFTLGDSSGGIIKCISYALSEMGMNVPSEDELLKTIGFSLRDTYEMLTGRDDAVEKSVFEGYFKELADEIMVKSTRLYDGVPELLKKINASGIKTAIVTTKHHYRIEGILKANGALDFIDLIVGGDDVKAPKPSPEGILKVKEYFGNDCSEILYIGDSVVDATAADGAGVDFIAVLTGTTSAAVFGEYRCLNILDNVSELVF